MNKGLKTGLIIGAVVVVLVMLFAGSYNGLIGKEEEVDRTLFQKIKMDPENLRYIMTRRNYGA